MNLEEKIHNYRMMYGVDGINLVIKRHELSNRKRLFFSARYATENKIVEEEYTDEMNVITREIEEVDKELFEKYGITKKESPQLIKDIKKFFPSGWSGGFS